MLRIETEAVKQMMDGITWVQTMYVMDGLTEFQIVKIGLMSMDSFGTAVTAVAL